MMLRNLSKYIRARNGFIAFLLIILVLVPGYLNPYLQHLFIMIFLFAFLGGSWNILGGFAGQFSFGHSLLFGIGAYVSTMLYVTLGITPWIGLILGAFGGMLVGLFVGYLSFHYGLRGYFFALIMLAFAEVARVVATNLNAIRGARGIFIPLQGHAPYLFQFTGKVYYYYIGLSLVILGLFVSYEIKKSRLGYRLLCIREDEEAASALGINAFKHKMIAMGISSFLTAIGGSFYAQYMMFIDPELVFGPQVSVEILLPTIIGGVGTIFGPLIGSAILCPISEIPRSLLQAYSGAYLLIYGIILIVVVIFFPNGVEGGLVNLHRRLSRKAEEKEVVK